MSLPAPRQPAERRKLALLGSTGSIGRNALEVVAGFPDRFEVVALAAGDNAAAMAAQVALFHPRLVSMRTESAVAELRQRLRQAGVEPPELHWGAEGLLAAATGGADLVLAATVGVAALRAIAAALRRGCDLALANKEALVVAGSLLMPEARRSGAVVLPVDSEHSAIHQCLAAGGAFERLILTASGGPFLRHTPEQMAVVTPAEALRHPTWSMGTRVTLDSATLMNKGFEVIEACHLFQAAESQVEVVIHPQSLVHSMVEFPDGSMLAQLGPADMRLPIQYALTWPDRLPNPRMRLKLEMAGNLEFEPPDPGRFPCLSLARAAFRAGQGAPAVLNAADEVAVAAFLEGTIAFTGIAGVVEQALERLGAPAVPDLDAVLAVDREARRVAQGLIGKVGSRV